MQCMISKNMAYPEPSAADQLEGRNLEGGWIVMRKISLPLQATGGLFSVGYEIQKKNGDKAFLKALDFSGAFAEEQPMLALQAMAASYNFERQVLEKCKGLSHVVAAIGDGTLRIPEARRYPDVPYLIFEMADGDLRKFLDISKNFDNAWALRCLHSICVGLEQLHGKGVAHQDLKPSNVLIFNGKESKIGDFGKAALREQSAPHDHEAVAGDKAYAPPELLYDAIAASDWNCRRYGCDMYLVGSLLVFVFSRITLTSAILSKMHVAHRPGSWGGTFVDIMPYLRNAFDETVIEFQQQLPPSLSELIAVVRQLGDPDPKRRGHPFDQIGHRSQYSLERYVGIFDRLAKRAELGLLKT